MKVTGIIVEYNPLHNGHIYHIKQTRQLTNCDLLIAIMSPNFVQRGQPAIIDKWERANEAIKQGCDLVIELPTPFVLQSATVFAQKAVDILNIAKIDSIVFGSEINNLEQLKEISEMPFNIDYFKANMKKGYSYPKAYSWMEDAYGPNDILGIAYLKALQQYPHITPYCIQRTSDYASDDLSNNCSALAIRKALENNEDILNTTPLSDKLLKENIPTLKALYPYIRSLLLTSDRNHLSNIFLMDEGIEAHLVKYAQDDYDYDSFINHVTTRRYTTSRIQRTLIHLLLNNTKEDMNNLPTYDCIRPLAFNQKGKAYLKTLKEQDILVADRFALNKKEYRDIEYKAAVIYSLPLSKDKQHEICRKEICGQYLDAKKMK